MEDVNNDQMEAQDDLLDDLMNIVQNEPNECLKKNPKFAQSQDEENKAEYAYKLKLENDDENNGHEYSDSDDYYVELEEDTEDIDEMLEKPIDAIEEKDQCNYYTYDKIQIKSVYWNTGQTTILPENWVQVTHASGMPLYLNRVQRVCTLSRPYYINELSARKHEIPISAIPCLAYKRRKEQVDNQIKEHNLAKAQATAADKCPMAGGVSSQATVEFQTYKEASDENNGEKEVKKGDNKKIIVSIQTDEEKSKENNIGPVQLHDYCKRLFEFDTVRVKKFKTWNDRKNFIKNSKKRNPVKFSGNAKMLKIQTKTQKGINKELSINLTNKTTLSILYEYASQVHKSNPRFEIVEKENPKDPFYAICYIADKISGRGTGNSKKMAKNAAAEAALSVLVPEFKSQNSETSVNKANDEAATFFDDYPIEHSHIYLHSQKLGSPLPYDVLLTCLKYNYAINMSRNHKELIEEGIKPIKYRNCLYTMKLGQYEVEVNCTKKKEGRQLAAQKILQQMHPHITNWGSLLRLYSTKMQEAYLNNDLNESSDVKVDKTPIEDSNRAPKPNKALLEKLKEEMRKLKRPVTNSKPSEEVIKDTLLTIPPLKLGDQIQSMNFLKTSEKIEAYNRKNDDIDGDDGKILFTTTYENDDSESPDSKKIKLHMNSDSTEESDAENYKTNSKICEDSEDDGQIKSSDSD